MEKRKRMSDEEIEAFAQTSKIGIVATVDPRDSVHITLLTSILARNESELLIGEFSRGASKEHMKINQKIGFFIMSISRKFWRGKASWHERKTQGEEYDAFSSTPLFNGMLRVSAVHYLGLEEISGPEYLPMVKIFLAYLITAFHRRLIPGKKKEEVLRPFIVQMINRLSSLSFLSYIDADGFPRIIPVAQCQAFDSSTLIFSHVAYRSELAKIQDGTDVAVFTMNPSMESVLVRGVFTGAKRKGIFGMCRVDIDWVYNSMLPVHGQVYPRVPYEAVTNF